MDKNSKIVKIIAGIVVGLMVMSMAGTLIYYLVTGIK